MCTVYSVHCTRNDVQPPYIQRFQLCCIAHQENEREREYEKWWIRARIAISLGNTQKYVQRRLLNSLNCLYRDKREHAPVLAFKMNRKHATKSNIHTKIRFCDLWISLALDKYLLFCFVLLFCIIWYWLYVVVYSMCSTKIGMLEICMHDRNDKRHKATWTSFGIIQFLWWELSVLWLHSCEDTVATASNAREFLPRLRVIGISQNGAGLQVET